LRPPIANPNATPSPAAAPGAAGAAAAPAPSSEQPPPEAIARLKEGEPTAFSNGQIWTLKGGQAVRIR